ncbi:unnamed protein product, partial [Onchocerca flexuosa]|uniref:G_PROTEIN_RECEP_F3_4 domain-containing protein n=1 Tax=Onchocerca flexuosa TaxID=387005 RepID=A0A183HFE3_9BILA
DQVNEAHLTGSISIIFCTTLTLCLVFVPKVVEIFRNPQGTERNYRRGLVKSSLGRLNSQEIPQRTEREHLQRLEDENVFLHQCLIQKASILLELRKQLKQLGELDDDSIESNDVIDDSN